MKNSSSMEVKENSVGMWGFIVEVLGELEGDEEASVSSCIQTDS